jgi:hypothetical protein
MNKNERWYEIVEGMAHIYDAPTANDSVSLSFVQISDLAYFRRTFRLRKVQSAA